MTWECFSIFFLHLACKVELAQIFVISIFLQFVICVILTYVLVLCFPWKMDIYCDDFLMSVTQEKALEKRVSRTTVDVATDGDSRRSFEVLGIVTDSLEIVTIGGSRTRRPAKRSPRHSLSQDVQRRMDVAIISARRAQRKEKERSETTRKKMRGQLRECRGSS